MQDKRSRSFYRRGSDHRGGVSVDFREIRRRFDFRSIQVGRWVTREENERAANLFYDALCDLMMVLQGNEDLISLRGTLSLQYGIGGQVGISAHYLPAQRTFSLAKNAGPGSIAHEWFHALDHYLADRAFRGATAGMFASSAWLRGETLISHPLNTLLAECFRIVLLDESGEQPSALFRTSSVIDTSLRQVYYSQPEEICARTFEAFVQDAPIKNNFLVKGTMASEEARTGLYPQGRERERMNAAWQQYFHALGHGLRRKPTTQTE